MCALMGGYTYVRLAALASSACVHHIVRFTSEQKSFETKVKQSVESCTLWAVKGDPLDSNCIKLNEDNWNVEVMRKAREEIFEKEVRNYGYN